MAQDEIAKREISKGRLVQDHAAKEEMSKGRSVQDDVIMKAMRESKEEKKMRQQAIADDEMEKAKNIPVEKMDHPTKVFYRKKKLPTVKVFYRNGNESHQKKLHTVEKTLLPTAREKKPKHSTHVLSANIVGQLKTYFAEYAWPNNTQKQMIADAMGLRYQTISSWF